MGNTFSLARHAFTELSDNVRTFKALKERIEAEPGLPVANPTRSFWMSPPSPIAHHCSDLPQYVDVVTVGSGITGTSVTKTLLDRAHTEGKLPVLLMLEAREACSGATGRYVHVYRCPTSTTIYIYRNGGHITPALYSDYADLRDDHGDAIAQKMIKLRLAHLHEVRRVAEEEGVLEESQWRQVETVDAYYNQELFAKAKAQVQGYQQALPFEASHHRVYESAEAIQV